MGKTAGDKVFESYEAKLARARIMAYISTVMYSFTWFLGFCALTWASAVILGGLLTALTLSDYYSVTALLLLEAGRLSTTTFFGKFVTLKLVHGSADPHRLKYNDVAKQSLLGLVGIVEQAVQLTVFAISIVVPIDRLLRLSSLQAASDQFDGFDGLKTSLRIFYVLVLVNGSIATVALMFAKHVVPFVLDSISLRKYYEKIVWKGMDEGLLHATDFELFSWAFEMQADEYRRNKRAVVVMKLYGDLMKFLYYHPNHKGFEAAKVALESSDTFEREAAANVVGLWVALLTEKKDKNSKNAPAAKQRKSDSRVDVSVSSGMEAGDEGSSKGKNGKQAWTRWLMQTKALLAKLVEALDNDESGRAAKQQKSDSRVVSVSSGMEAGDEGSSKGKNEKQEWTRLLMQTKLLAKLAEALDNDESGRAASYSFLTLAEKTDPERVLRVRSEGKDEKVADILMDQIHRLVKMKRPNNALTYIKALIPLLEHLSKSWNLHECMTLASKKKAERSELYCDGMILQLIKRELEGCESAGVGKYCTPAKLGRLKEDMWTIVSEYASGLKRLQVVAAYAYYLLLSDHERNDEAYCRAFYDYLRQRTEDKDTHILDDEQEYLVTMLPERQLPSTWKDLVEIRACDKKPNHREVPWLARRSIALIASLVSLGILLISSIAIVKYASF